MAEVSIEISTWPDLVKCYAKRWRTSQNKAPFALLIALHGFAEHVGRYDHVWPAFSSNGIEVFAYDQRGAGRSGPRHGDTTLAQNLEDLKFIMSRERQGLDNRGLKGVPIWLYGHSMVS